MNKENLFVYEEDGFCELRYTYGDLAKFERKAKKYIKLQSNWNSLREWLEKNYKESQDIWYVKIINKMNELESGD